LFDVQKYEKVLRGKGTQDLQNVLSISIPQLALLLYFITSWTLYGQHSACWFSLVLSALEQQQVLLVKESYFAGLPKRDCKWKTHGRKSLVLQESILFLL